MRHPPGKRGRKVTVLNRRRMSPVPAGTWARALARLEAFM